MTKSKKVQKAANKAAKVEEPKAVNLSPDELLEKAREAFGKKFPEPVLTLAKTPLKEPKEPKGVLDEIMEDMERGDEDDELEIIEVPVVKGKKVIPQNSAQAQKLLNKKVTKAEMVAEVRTQNERNKAAAQAKAESIPAKKKVSEMTEKERKIYYANLSKKALAAKQAKAEAKLASEGKTDQLEKVPEIDTEVALLMRRFKLSEKEATALINKEKEDNETPEPKKSKRTAPVVPVRVIPEGTTGSKLKTLKKVEKKEEKKSNKPAKTSKRTAPAGEKFTRMQAVGMVIKANPKATTEEWVKISDKLYTDMTGAESNIKETQTQVGKAVNFLLGYNA